jgi:hypothetical protein
MNRSNIVYLKKTLLAGSLESDSDELVDPRCYAMDQLTSSQQALPCLPLSQGLYALHLMRIGVGVHSLSARSFKVRHGMHMLEEVEEWYVPE